MNTSDVRNGGRIKSPRHVRDEAGTTLEPEEADTVALMEAMEKVVEAKDVTERATRTDEATTIARRLLKREWVRIKTDLASSE
jgi:hypothetical protein